MGEILSENETRALFHCLSAGLKGLQTTHASKLTGLLNRWIVHYGIEKDCLNDFGIIVFMKKIGQFRKILSINELLFDNISQEIGTKTYYEYNPQNKDWLEKDSILNAKFLDEIRKSIYFPDEIVLQFTQIILNEIDSFIVKNQRTLFNPFEMIYPQLKSIISE